MLKCLFLVFAAVLVAACSHPQQMVGKGDILSYSGTRNCLYDDFIAHQDPATQACPNYVAGDYYELYYPRPHGGWLFTGWQGCPEPAFECAFQVEEEAVRRFWGQELPPLVAQFEQYYRFERIGIRVRDAEYDRVRDRLVILSERGHIYLYDLVSRQWSRIDMASRGNSLSLSRDGTRAAVAHPGYVTLVDLIAEEVDRVYDTSTNAVDTVLPGNGFLYVMPSPPSSDFLRTINLATGEEKVASSYSHSVFGGLRMVLHPSGDYAYAAQNYTTSWGAVKLDVRSEFGVFLAESRQDESMCGKLWISTDGDNLITACGAVFSVSEDPAQDMQYHGRLERPGPLGSSQSGPGMLHVSQLGDEVLHISQSVPNRIYRHRYSDFSFTDSVSLPQLERDGVRYATEGKFVFHTSDGSHIAIAAADEADGLTYGHGIVHRVDGSAIPNSQPWAITEESIYAYSGEFLALDGSESFDPEGAGLTYQWALLSAPAGSGASIISATDTQTGFVPDTVGHYLVGLTVSDGELTSEQAVLSIEVENRADEALVPLGFTVMDAALSSSLNHLVMLAESTNLLVQYDLGSGEVIETLLPEAGDVLAVNPGGSLAVVGHVASNALSLVRLHDGLHLGTLYSGVGIHDLVVADNGHAYVFGPSNYNYLQTVNLLSGAVQLSPFSLLTRTHGVMHPDGVTMYGLGPGIPNVLTPWDISAILPLVLPRSNHYRDYDACRGPLWVAATGARLFTPCGLMYTADPGNVQDILYAGLINVGGEIESLSHSGNEVALLHRVPSGSGQQNDESGVLSLYRYDNQAHVRDIELPDIEVGAQSYPARGQFVFHDEVTPGLVVIMQAVDSAGLVSESALYRR